MPISELIQLLIHKLDTGAGARVLRYLILALLVFALGIAYDLHCYKNMSTPEGMDTAQLARNIARGKGYTTEFIRPLSLYLVQTHNVGKAPISLTSTNLDLAHIQNHPDLANPPVYPELLAGLMKVLPFNYPVDMKSSFWSDGERFSRYQPDFMIAVFNQVLLLAVATMVFLLGHKLFDARVAWTSAVLVIGCETLWHFTLAGISTLFLILVFLALAWCLVKLEELAREPEPRANLLLGWVIASGALTGIGALTRYSFGWVIVPVVIFVILYSGPRRILHAMLALGVFLVVMAPWVFRNYNLSGTMFGTAGFATMENTGIYPQFSLERSIQPNFFGFVLRPYLTKLMMGLQTIICNELPVLGGSWVSIFFLAGLMLGFQKAPIKRLRHFLLLCLGMFILCQSLGRTALSDEAPTFNSENLLILLAPLVFIYGTTFFFTLLDQLELPTIELRYPIVGGFVLLSCLPLIFILLSPKISPSAYPPYFPPEIQRVSGWMQPDELMMSDIPWAVSWYGDHQCIWLSDDANDDYFAINDNIKTVSAIYLSPETMNGKYLTDWVYAPDNSWGHFISQVVTKNQIPPRFPLRSPQGFLPDRLFLTDYARWKMDK
jgi:hypothetical protein